MFTLYLAIGLAVIFWKDFPLDMALGYRIAFGALLIAYAFIRFMRLLQQRD
jgi:hypothetical protein